MRCLTIILDDRELFSGNVAEYQVTENDESVTVTGRFNPTPTVASTLQRLGQAAAAQREANASPGPRPTLVRDEDE